MAGPQYGVTSHDFINGGRLDHGYGIAANLLTSPIGGVPQGGFSIVMMATGAINPGDVVVLDTGNEMSVVKTNVAGSKIIGVALGRTVQPFAGLLNQGPSESLIVVGAGLIQVTADDPNIVRGSYLTYSTTAGPAGAGAIAGRVMVDGGGPALSTTIGYALQAQASVGGKLLMLVRLF